MEALKKIGMEHKYIRILRKIYLKSNAEVRTEKVGTTFKLEKGVKQGDPISPKLFTSLLVNVLKEMDWGEKKFDINT